MDFWKVLDVPHQQADDNFQFANPVVVAQRFMQAASVAKTIGHNIELLTEELARLNIKLAQEQRKLVGLRRDILARNYPKAPKSGTTELKEAFILHRAQAENKEAELRTLESTIAGIEDEIALREPQLQKLQGRMKMLERAMSWGEQYLNYDKVLTRMETK